MTILNESYHKKVARPPIRLNLGCGSGADLNVIGVDSRPLEGVDVVHDLETPMDFLEDGSVYEIFSKSFLEHIHNLNGLMRDCWRVLKPGGKFHAVVPHFSNPHYYSDPTHVRYFGLYTFEYFCKIEDQRFYRKVPNYDDSYGFKTTKLEIIFEEPRIHMHNIVNANTKAQEHYEKNLCWTQPAYGMLAVLEAVK